MRKYVQRHLNLGSYVPRSMCLPDSKPYCSVFGWKDYVLGEDLLFSHRTTYYTKSTFDQVPREHDYWELVIPVAGAVDYVCGDGLIPFEDASVVWFSPGKQHTALLREDGKYERYVFYFRAGAFSDRNSTLLRFAARSEDFSLRLSEESRTALLRLLEALGQECEGECNLLLCRALAVQILAFVDRCGNERASSVALPAPVVAIRRYIDEHFRSIGSVAELAKKFFYTREHLTRLFKRYYNISVSAYVIRCRLLVGAKALEEGASVTRAAYDCGFDSLSAFTCAFRKEYGISPKEYSKLHKERSPRE